MNAAHPVINTSRWTPDEDQTLLDLVVKYTGVNWDAMANELNVRSVPYYLPLTLNAVHPDCPGSPNCTVGRRRADAAVVACNLRLSVCLSVGSLGSAEL